jgi:DNA gyrase/topoisomerase IV subunit B
MIPGSAARSSASCRTAPSSRKSTDYKYDALVQRFREMAFLTRALTMLNDYACKASLLKDSDPNFSGDDVREGLTAIISINLQDPSSSRRPKGS